MALQKNPCPTPLLVACDKNKTEVAQYLIEKGANINCQNKVCFFFPAVVIAHYPKNFTQNGTTPLHLSCLKGHTAVAKLLIESRAKLEIKNNVSVELLVACIGMGS